MLRIVSKSAEDTMRLGEMLGKVVEPGDFIALTGELGSGKTHFVKGVAVGIGVENSVQVSSPTYTLINEYQGRHCLYHFDLYRLNGGTEIIELGLEEYFFGNGVCIVEWAERLKSELPNEYLSILFDYEDENFRQIEFVPHGARYEILLKKCFDRCQDSCY